MDNHSRGMTAPTREAVSYPKQSVTLKKVWEVQGSNLRGHPKLVMRDRNEKSLLCFGCSMPVIPPVLPPPTKCALGGGGYPVGGWIYT